MVLSILLNQTIYSDIISNIDLLINGGNMKRNLILIMVVLILTGCKLENGNSVSKLETTIFKTFSHEEIVIEEGFNAIKSVFTDKDVFYHASLLTMEYGVEGTSELEEKIKSETNSYDVLYITFSMKTGDVAYEAMKSNHIYYYETYLIKSYKNDIWHVYKMDGRNELNQ